MIKSKIVLFDNDGNKTAEFYLNENDKIHNDNCPALTIFLEGKSRHSFYFVDGEQKVPGEFDIKSYQIHEFEGEKNDWDEEVSSNV